MQLQREAQREQHLRKVHVLQSLEHTGSEKIQAECFIPGINKSLRTMRRRQWFLLSVAMGGVTLVETF